MLVISGGNGEREKSLQIAALAPGDWAAVISPRCRVTRLNTRSIPDCVILLQPNHLQHSPSITLKVLSEMQLDTGHREERLPLVVMSLRYLELILNV